MKKAIILGGGIAGLTAAYYLHKAGQSFDLFEKSDHFGGRLKTDRAAGFVFDHGFQVMLNAYPELQRIFKQGELGEKTFSSGAVLVTDEGNKRVADPSKHFGAGVGTLFSGALPISDLLKMNSLKNALKKKTVQEIWSSDEMPTLAYLKSYGFSDKAIHRFFKPFYGGIFLEDELSTPSVMFQFTFKMFGEGEAALPAQGIQQIADALVAKLPADQLHKSTEVVTVQDNNITLSTGEQLEAEHIIDCRSLPSSVEKWNSAQCLYFRSDFPLTDRFIHLDSRKSSPIKNIALLSAVQSGFAPAGKGLVSVTLRERERGENKEEVLSFVASALQKKPSSFGFLRAYAIPYALPVLVAGKAASANPTSKSWQAGDVVSKPSLNEAMASARSIVAALLR